MARTIRNAKIDTRSSRIKLIARREPYWTVLTQGCIVGYRKGVKGGTWVAKFRRDDGQRFQEALGSADDATDADGVGVLSYAQAQEKARDWFTRQSRIQEGMEEIAGPYTVADAVKAYLEHYIAQKAPSKHTLGTMHSRINAFILPTLGTKDVQKLTTRTIRTWMNTLAETPPRARTGRFNTQQNFRDADMNDTDQKRRRRHTVNKVMAVLKSALNHAWREGKVPSDDAWRKVSPFPNVDAPRIRYLTEEESVRLVNASPPDFRRMVQAAMLTGCRYGELTSMLVGDLDLDAGTVFVRDTKTKKPRHVVLTTEAMEFFRQQIISKPNNALMFTREDGGVWGKNHQQRPMAAACEGASIIPAIGFHILRHTHGSRLAGRGVPMAVIAAQLGHSDTRMTEKHYAHLAPSYIADTIRASFGRIGIVEENNVVSIASR